MGIFTLYAEPELLTNILPASPNNTFIEGYPGLTSFTIRASVRITNTHKSKPKKIGSIRLEFRGSTIVSYPSTNGWSAPGMALETHLENKKDLLEGAGQVPTLAPGESRDFAYEFAVASPTQGGPTYLPHAMKKPYSWGEAFTAYSISVRVFMPKSGIFASDPQPNTAEVSIPLTWHTPANLNEVLRIDALPPKPGWINTRPVNLPPSVKPSYSNSPIELDLTFPSGLTFGINDTISFTTSIRLKTGTQNVQIKSLTLRIQQIIAYKGVGKSHIKTFPYDIFTHTIKNSEGGFDFHQFRSFSPILEQFKSTDDPAILPTRCNRRLDPHLMVFHRLFVTVDLKGASDVKLMTPCNVVPWKRAEMVEFVRDNPVVVREAMEGIQSSEYLPEYDFPPEYEQAVEE
ncbi:hypothetical protein HK097_000966 [Rhizophlyctis rosea]|uniref:Uncharacterized protein n=1 Tax=Rhizophlyctis rosea TaxID=64517 RepID=A0AAD5S6P0_9FUNG|nr:hypothetical protein HK097_000966 [Rhizophlyctis rosea]